MCARCFGAELEPYYILHYTYGDDYTLDGMFTPGKVGAWHFDKRTWAGRPVDRHLKPPPDGAQSPGYWFSQP